MIDTTIIIDQIQIPLLTHALPSGLTIAMSEEKNVLSVYNEEYMFLHLSKNNLRGIIDELIYIHNEMV